MQKELQQLMDRPQELMRHATDIAGVCKAIVVKSAVNIQGKKYVPVEGWMSIATAHGCCLSAGQVEAVDGGIRAVGEVRRIKDGAIIATAEGFVGDDESTWSKRPMYARRAMAQTRAMSRAARSAFAHVVTLMGAGLATTPAEEVPSDGFAEKAVNADPVRPLDAPEIGAPVPDAYWKTWTGGQKKLYCDQHGVKAAKNEKGAWVWAKA